jgi:hypothetical protein
MGRAIWEQFYFGCFRNLEIPHGHPFFAWSSVLCMVIRSLLPVSVSLETMHDPKEPGFLIALKIVRHAMLCLSVIIFLICVCWHPERMCRALSTCEQRGQV